MESANAGSPVLQKACLLTHSFASHWTALFVWKERFSTS